MHYVLSGLVKMSAVSQAQADLVDPLVGGSRATPAQQAQRQARLKLPQTPRPELLNCHRPLVRRVQIFSTSDC